MNKFEIQKTRISSNSNQGTYGQWSEVELTQAVYTLWAIKHSCIHIIGTNQCNHHCKEG